MSALDELTFEAALKWARAKEAGVPGKWNMPSPFTEWLLQAAFVAGAEWARKYPND